MNNVFRLREGYTGNSIKHKDSDMNKHQTFIHYYSVWPLTSGPEANKSRLEVTLAGP